jgi:co-chaperonin GroES (HSP10)
MIKMIGRNVLVTETEKENTTSGGIILTEAITKGSKPGLVLAVGPHVTDVAKGDRVFLQWDKAMAVDVEGKGGAIIDESFIKAVLNV